MYKPVSAVWYTPSFCNRRCAYCNVQDKRLGWLPGFSRDKRNIAAFLRAADTLHHLGIPWVSFVGGEPLLFSSALKGLFRRLSGYGMGYGITTNWSVPVKRCRDILAGCHSVNLSFDSINPHYSLSKKNDCARLVRFIRESSAFNPRLLFNATVVFSSHSADDLPRTMEWLWSLKGMGFVFVQPCSEKKYAPTLRQVRALKDAMPSMGKACHERSNLAEVLGYYFEKDKRSLRKDCGMFFSQYRIFPDRMRKGAPVSFIIRPCSSYYAENASQEWTYFKDASLDDARQCREGIDSLNRLADGMVNASGGFYGSCNVFCTCGPEMAMNDVFWGRRTLTMLTRDRGLARKIAVMLAANRRDFEAAVNKAMATPVRPHLLSGIGLQEAKAEHHDLLTRKSIKSFPLPPAVCAAVKKMQEKAPGYPLRESRKKLGLSAQEFDALRGLLFRGAMRMFPSNSRSLL